jgi:hypothetical protein
MGKKPGTAMLDSLMPPAKVERPPAPPAPLPEPAGSPPSRPQANRMGRVMVAGYFGTETSFALRELTVKMSRKRGQRVTLQDALGEAIALLFEKHEVAPPDEVSRYLR